VEAESSRQSGFVIVPEAVHGLKRRLSVDHPKDQGLVDASPWFGRRTQVGRVR